MYIHTLKVISFFKFCVHVFNTLQSLIISLNDVSDILHIFMNKIYTFHVTVHDLEVRVLKVWNVL